MSCSDGSEPNGELRRSLDRNYGDIDVLAWNTRLGRVLAIEYKDLQFHKTMGEVAEQLADFRGEISADGRPDHLKRHLDRLDVLAIHKDPVRVALGMGTNMNIEGHLVFKTPVPMQFSWEHMEGRVKLSLFEELRSI
jgi:hypothetical protein